MPISSTTVARMWTSGRRVDLGADGDLEQQDDERHADAVVEAALEVQRLAGVGGHARGW